jgi:predicted secreted protein
MAVIELGSADAGRVVEARPGDDVIVRLSETPTSGYRWEADAGAASALLPATDEYLPGDGTLGGSGTRVFHYAVAVAGTATIRLVRRRAWEPATQAVETFAVTVTVE